MFSAVLSAGLAETPMITGLPPATVEWNASFPVTTAPKAMIETSSSFTSCWRAGLAFLFGLDDEAGVQLDRVPADAAELRVDVVDGRLGPRGRLGELVRPALRVDPTDRDGGHALVGRAGRAAGEAEVVGDDVCVAAGRARGAGGSGGGGGAGGARGPGGGGRAGRGGGAGGGRSLPVVAVAPVVAWRRAGGSGRSVVVVIVGARGHDECGGHQDGERSTPAPDGCKAHE